VAIQPGVTPYCISNQTWRRGSESNAVFTDYQPQHPDFQGCSNTDFTGVQAVFVTTRQLSGLTRHVPPFCSVIEEIVEGFVEGFGDRATTIC